MVRTVKYALLVLIWQISMTATAHVAAQKGTFNVEMVTSDYHCRITDEVVYVNGASNIYLPSPSVDLNQTPVWSTRICIKDTSGAPSFSVSDPTPLLIDGAVSYAYTQGYQVAEFGWNGSGWSVLSCCAGHAAAYVGPLDIEPSAIAGYSNRALSAAKRGTALYTIRRSSDNTTQSFNSDATTGDAPVASINTFLSGSNPFVTLWKDQSASALDVLQATTTVQPNWVASANGGRPGINFPSVVTNPLDNTGPVFQLTSSGSLVLTGSGYTFFVVIHATDALNGGIVLPSQFIFSSNNAITFATINTTIFFDSATDPTTATADAEASDGTNLCGGGSVENAGFVGSYVLVDGAIAFGSWSVDLNGVSISLASSSDAGGTLTTPVNVGPLTIGTDSPSEVSPLNALNGTIQEIIIFPGIIGRAAIRANIAAYYGISI